MIPMSLLCDHHSQGSAEGGGGEVGTLLDISFNRRVRPRADRILSHLTEVQKILNARQFGSKL